MRLVDEFKKKGNNVITVDKNAFREAVLKSTKPTDHGLPPAGLRPHHRHQVMAAVAMTDQKIIDDEGHFHAQDEVVDL